MVGEVVDDLRRASQQLSPEQAQIVQGLREAAVLIDDAATATAGFADSLTRAGASIEDAARAGGSLSASFEQMARLAQVEIQGSRPLEPLSEQFIASADSFGQLGGSLDRTADSLAENVRATTRVAADLRAIQDRVQGLEQQVGSLRPLTLAGRGLDWLELGLRGLLIIQALISLLTGLALLLQPGARPAGVSGTTPG